jgi:hypothetical protein
MWLPLLHIPTHIQYIDRIIAPITAHIMDIVRIILGADIIDAGKLTVDKGSNELIIRV